MSWIEALLSESAGHPARAAATLAETWDLNTPVRYLQAASRAMAPDVVRLALAVGDRQRARSVAEELERSADITATPTARGFALRCRGLLDDDAGVLLEAVAAHRGGPRPYPLAGACEDAGIALAWTARSSDAESLLDEAKAIYEQLDAVHDLDRLLSARRGAGIRRARRAPPPARFGWEV